MKKLFIFLLLAIAFIVIIGIITRKLQSNKGALNFSNQAQNSKEVIIGDNKITVEIADTENTRFKGLSGKDKIDENTGMLFVFDGSAAIRTFWMKDMKFPLDFIWINDNKIIQIDKGIQIPQANTPDANLPTYTSKEPVNYVLEVNAGYTDKNNIKVGDSVQINL